MKSITYDDTKFVLVPIEPSNHMLIAGLMARKEGLLASGIYRAMLAAAPTPTTEAQVCSSQTAESDRQTDLSITGETQTEAQAVSSEPVAWMSESEIGFDKAEFGNTPVVPLYLHPAAERPDHRAVMTMALEALERIGEPSSGVNFGDNYLGLVRQYEKIAADAAAALKKILGEQG